MDTFLPLIGVIVAIVLVLWFVLHGYNRLVAMRNKVRNAWSDVDVQLTFRHDLVPSLVESVKGYMSHEREVLEDLAQARSKAITAGEDVGARALAETALGTAVGNLFVVAEHYPQLKAYDNFLLLQEQLTTTENRIAFARQHYNDTVRQFNTFIAELPWNLMTGWLGYSPEKMFAAESQDRATLKIHI